MPTALSQIAQMADPYARTSFEYRNIPQTTVNKALSKIPGARENLTPVVDVLGHDVEAYGGNNSLFNVFPSIRPTSIPKRRPGPRWKSTGCMRRRATFRDPEACALLPEL